MANVKKVILGLECCKQGADYTDPICSECPYSDEYAADCVPMLAADALFLLKEQRDEIKAFRQLVERAEAGIRVEPTGRGMCNDH